MKMVFSGEYYGSGGMQAVAAGVGLALGNERTGVILTGSAIVIGGTGYGYAADDNGFAPGQDGGTGLAVAAGIVANGGSIFGGLGGNAAENGTGNAGDGGVAVSFAGRGIFMNDGMLEGGQGGFGGVETNAGNGGVALYMGGGGIVINDAAIYGGSSNFTPANGTYVGGNGAAGIVLNGSGIVLNAGTIRGGSGVVGGAGIDAKSDGLVTNHGEISGGSGFGTLGGAGISLGVNGVLRNFGTIAGGSAFGNDAFGGDGAVIYGGKTPDINSGLIIGGSSSRGPHYYYGNVSDGGGAGLVLLTAGTLINTGTISGGRGRYEFGGFGGHGGVDNRISVYLPGGSTFINSGTIDSDPVEQREIAVVFGDDRPSRLILEPGSVINGVVLAAGPGNVIELAGGKFGALTNIGYETGPGISYFQTLELGGSSSGTITGFGPFASPTTMQADHGSDWTISGTVGDLHNAGIISIENGSSLDVSLVDPSSSGIFALTGKASLEIGQLLGSQTQIEFLGSRAGNLLTIDTPSSFGLHVGGTNFAGPSLEDFRMSDAIDLRGIGETGLKTQYDAKTGILQISSSSGGVVASLQFQTASLGAGSFHLTSDDAGGSLLKLV